MDRLVRAGPAAPVVPVVPVVDLALHQIVRPAGTDFQTIKKRENP